MRNKIHSLCMLSILLTLLLIILIAACATRGKISNMEGLLSIDEAFSQAVIQFETRIPAGTDVVIYKVTSPLDDVSEFLAEEMGSYLNINKKFRQLARGDDLEALDEEHQFQMSGMVSDESAVGIGHYRGAKVVITGSFQIFAGFSQLRLRALDVNDSTRLAEYSARIRPDDIVLANIVGSSNDIYKPEITTEALAHLNAAEDFLEQKRYQDAITELNQVLAINNNLADGYKSRGLAHFYIGEFEKAIQDWNTALRINPNMSIVWSNRGTVYLQTDEYDKAIADFTAALKIQPENIYALYNRGVAYFKKQEYGRAIDEFNTVLKIYPNDTDTLDSRARAYFMTGEYDKALNDCRLLLIYRPGNVNNWILMGLVCMEKRDYDLAITALEAALQIVPNNAEVKRFLERARVLRGN